MTVKDALRGITPPIVTPFSDDAVDHDALAAVIDHVEAGGVDAVFPGGTTGEYASLGPAERRAVIETTVERASVPVIAGAGATSVDETVANVERAAGAGADAAVVTAPYFHTASEPAGNRRFFEAVLERTELPLVLYDIPQCTGRAIEPATVAALAERDRVLGIKDSSGDLAHLLRLVRETPPEFLVLQGYDALLVPALRMGADGGINALANVVPSAFRVLSERADEDRGRAVQEAIVPLFDACLEAGFAPATKAALVARGVVETDAVRPPLVDVDDRAPIEAALEEALAGA